MEPCLPTTGCSLTHGLPYIFLQINYAASIFLFLLSAGLFVCLEVHLCVLQSFALVLIIFNVFSHGLHLTWQLARLF